MSKKFDDDPDGALRRALDRTREELRQVRQRTAAFEGLPDADTCRATIKRVEELEARLNNYNEESALEELRREWEPRIAEAERQAAEGIAERERVLVPLLSNHLAREALAATGGDPILTPHLLERTTLIREGIGGRLVGIDERGEIRRDANCNEISARHVAEEFCLLDPNLSKAFPHRPDAAWRQHANQNAKKRS